MVGSLPYYSPEQLRQGEYDEKIDVWGVGVMAYELILGRSPFQDDIIKIAKQEIEPELPEVTFPVDTAISDLARSFLTSLLNKDPGERIGIHEALRHEFIQRHINE